MAKLVGWLAFSQYVVSTWISGLLAFVKNSANAKCPGRKRMEDDSSITFGPRYIGMDLPSSVTLDPFSIELA